MKKKIVITVALALVCLYSGSAVAAGKKVVRRPVTGSSEEEVAKKCKAAGKKKAANAGLAAGTPAFNLAVKKFVNKCIGGADKDGVADSKDNCPALFNNDQADTDSDGIGNVCDNCSAVANPDQANTDGDIAGNACDNCVSVPNNSQGDLDSNGIGNACEIVDIVVGSRNHSKALIFRDALNGDTFRTQDSALLLSDAPIGSDINNPRGINVVNNRLLFANRNSGRIAIWNNFSTITDEQPHDITLNDCVSGPRDALVDPVTNDLYVTSRDTFNVCIWRDIATVNNLDAADVELDLTQGAEEVDASRGLALANNKLYVAGCARGESDSKRAVYIYNSPSTLTNLSTPNVILNQLDSLVGCPMSLQIIDNKLYVGDRAGVLLVFDNADSLVTGQEPSAVVPMPGATFTQAVVGSRLFVGVRNANQYAQAAGPLGMVAFDNFSTLTDGSSPTITFGREVTSGTEVISIAHGSLWVADLSGYVLGWRDAASLTSDQEPDFVFYIGSTSPKGLLAVER